MIQSIFWSAQKKRFFKLSHSHLARIYYRDYYQDLLRDQRVESPIHDWLEQLGEEFPTNFEPSFRVIHLAYEFGEMLLLGNAPKDQPLAIEIKFSAVDWIQPLAEFTHKSRLKLIDQMSFKDYQIKFKQVQKELLAGNCYQLNLTSKSHYVSSESLASIWQTFASKPSKLSAYAHATFLSENWGIISNSPECLVQRERESWVAYPIKGTEKISTTQSLNKAWKRMLASKKQRAELVMITDLLRNDLSRLGLPLAQVELPFPRRLTVPGLIHQVAKIKTPIHSHTSTLDLLQAVYPGGSITGAPKVNVLRLIKKIENQPRGFYCGSTILNHAHIWQASINIRTMEYENGNCMIGAGGGITLKSRLNHEWDEMIQKRQSLIDLWS